jgi:hypothetical protein
MGTASPRIISRVIAAVVLAAQSSFLFGLAAASAAAARSPPPIVLVTRHGGLCVAGRECRTTLRIDDRTISAAGYAARQLKARERVELLRAVDALDAKYLAEHPFSGTCPIAYDGTESVYRFRGFVPSLPGCTYDLRGVAAVRVAERLFASLKPTARK